MKPLISLGLAVSILLAMPAVTSADPDAGAWDPRVEHQPSLLGTRSAEHAFQWEGASYSERLSFLVDLGTPPSFAARAAMGGFPLAGHPLVGDGRLLVIRPQRGGAALIVTF